MGDLILCVQFCFKKYSARLSMYIIFNVNFKLNKQLKSNGSALFGVYLKENPTVLFWKKGLYEI